MKTLAIYPGTFDPVTRGHFDLIRRARKIFSRLIIAVAADTHKQAFFSLDERIKLLNKATKHLDRVEVESFSGLLVEYMRKRKAQVALRGLRAISDFEYEFQLALMNRKLYPEFEIIYMMPDERYTYISSSLIKEIASLGGGIKDLVPNSIHDFIIKKFQAKRKVG